MVQFKEVKVRFRETTVDDKHSGILTVEHETVPEIKELIFEDRIRLKMLQSISVLLTELLRIS